jgi:hypothetical protein
MGNADLRREARIESRAVLTKTLDQLQRAMKVIPQEVLYQPTFMYIWTLAEARFPKRNGENRFARRSRPRNRRAPFC